MLAIGLVAAVSAQGRNFAPRDNNPGQNTNPGRNMRPPVPNNFNRVPGAPQLTREQVTVTGELTLVRGNFAVKDGDTTYFILGLNRYVGFIDTLKDGAKVTLEGNAITSPQNANNKVLTVSKLTVGGKDYDLARPALNPQNRLNQQTPGQPRMQMPMNPRMQMPRQAPAPRPLLRNRMRNL